MAGAFGLSPSFVSDHSAGWSVYNEAMQASARDQLARIRPYLEIFSPMTSTAETLHRVAPSEDKTARERMLCNARDHLRFILEDLILAQITLDGKFVLVLPKNWSSWESLIVKALVENEAMARVRVCRSTSGQTNNGEIATVFNADVWKLL